jgi:hypothetical protein
MLSRQRFGLFGISKAARSTKFVLLRAAVSQTGVSATRQDAHAPNQQSLPPKCDREHRNTMGDAATLLQQIYRLPSPE